MPDGATMILDDAIATACARMDTRLVMWGRIVIRGGAGPRLKWDSDDDELDRREWTGREQDEAVALHSKVIRLPEVRQRLVLQVFYREYCAAHWHQVQWPRRGSIIDDLTDEVNYRIRKHNRQVEVPAPTIQDADFEPIRGRSIRILVNNERVMGLTVATKQQVQKTATSSGTGIDLRNG